MTEAVKAAGPTGGPKAPTLPTGPQRPGGLVPDGTRGAPPGRVPRPTPPARVPRPAPVARDREGGAIPGVSGRLNTLLDESNPYIDRARTRAKQYANRRGLMNSSIAAGAGEAAAIDAALPIATADASIASTERVAEAQRNLQDLISQRNVRSQELMQERGLSHDAAQRQAERELRGSIAQAERSLQRGIARMRSEDEAAAREASTRVAQQQIVARIGSDYQQTLDRIDANPNIPSDERAEARKRAAIHRDEMLSMTQQLGGHSFEWSPYEPVADEEEAA